MFKSLIEIFSQKIAWTSRLIEFAGYDLLEQVRDTKLGAIWLFARPVVYIFCFWFSLQIGLRIDRALAGDVPFILWLAAGILPWNFLASALTSGSNSFRKHSFVVKSSKVPLAVIPTISCLSSFYVELICQAVILTVCLIIGWPLGPHMLQIPLLLLMMFVFWDTLALFLSSICTISKDLKQFVSVLYSPIFWTAGVFFDTGKIAIQWVQDAFLFNPFSFFISSFRDVYCNGLYLWDCPERLAGFAVSYVVLLICALVAFSKNKEKIPDAV